MKIPAAPLSALVLAVAGGSGAPADIRVARQSPGGRVSDRLPKDPFHLFVSPGKNEDPRNVLGQPHPVAVGPFQMRGTRTVGHGASTDLLGGGRNLRRCSVRGPEDYKHKCG